MKKTETRTSPREALFPSRRIKSLLCPHCWTAQRAERDFCYRCGAIFRYQDEERPGKVG